MEPIELFDDFIFKKIGLYAAICGAAIMRPDWKPTGLVVFWVTLNISCLVFSLYTLVAYDADTVWKLLTIFGVVIQGVVKFVCVIYYARTISGLVAFLRRVFASNTRPDCRNYTILHHWSLMFWYFSRAGIVIILGSCLMLLPLTLSSNFLRNRHELPLPMYLPAIDADTQRGWYVTFGYQIVLLLLGGFGLCATDLMLIVLVLHMWPLSAIFVDQFVQLNRATRHIEGADGRQKRRLQWFFRNMLRMHNDICEFIATVSDVYFFVIFCEIYTDGLSLCAVIFCHLTIDWLNVYFVLGLSLIKLFVYCLLGTMVEITTDRMLDTIVQSNWYLLPQKMQLMFIRMVAVAQNPIILQAGTMPVNLDTFVNVIKTVYSVGMLLIETVQ